jgi:hypothetical protein
MALSVHAEAQAVRAPAIDSLVDADFAARAFLHIDLLVARMMPGSPRASRA